MLSYGMVEADVAAALGIDAKTLRKHFATEIRTAFINANASVKQSLFRTATDWMKPDKDGNPAGKPTRESVLAAIFWDKTRGGAIETVNVNSRARVDATTESRVTLASHEAAVESARILDELGARLAAGATGEVEVVRDRTGKATPPTR